ncbi:MAG: hypothetical protein QN648_02260 [Nitrososphaeraceae archaeon]|nr:hypothetical protein [Nitrososphaeraceae archaeon]
MENKKKRVTGEEVEEMRKCTKCGNVFDFESSLIDKCLSCQTGKLK